MKENHKIPRVVLFAGPNGSGKSSHADAILERLNISIFVNADYIARGLSGKNTEAVNFEAGRIMLNRIKELAELRQDFAFESTLSALCFVKFLNELKSKGYMITIVYFWVKNANLAYSRVRKRVKEGGHDIPQKIITRRFYKSIYNFVNLYMPIAHIWFLIDNSFKTGQLVVSCKEDEVIVVKEKLWETIKIQAKSNKY